MDTFARSEPPTPQDKHVAFNDALSRRRPHRMHSYGDGAHHRVGGHRNKSIRSVYLRDGEIHSVWKPKHNSLTSPTTPSPPPTNFADVVSEVMRQKLNLRERQRKLFSRVTATQAVLKEQNEELAAVAELTEEDEEKEREEGLTSEGVRNDTPSKKMWKQAIKTVINENKDEEKKTKKLNRKRSTVHFHEVVTNKLATMDPTGARGCPSISEQSGTPQVPTTPQKVRRNASLSRKRQDAVTPSGAIPFSEWKNKYYEKQRMSRHRSDYIKSQRLNQGHLHRISSDNNLTLPAQRRASIASAEDLEPRSKSVSQYHPANALRLRRSSSPAIIDYDDHGEISDGSVALDMFSPLSSRSVSPSVFSDEEERRSKMQSRTPVSIDEVVLNSKPHQPLMKLDSVETRVLSNPSNMTKRVQKRNQYRKMYQDSAQSGDDVIELDPVPTKPAHPTNVHGRSHSPRDGQRTRRLKPDSISLSEPPRHTPSPRPTSHPSSRGPSPAIPFGKGQHGSMLTSPIALNDRISQEQSHRESRDLEDQRHNRVASPDRTHLRRSSTPDILNPPAPTQPSAQRRHRKSTPSPPPYIPLPGPRIVSQTPRGQGGRHRSPSPGSHPVTHTLV